LPVDLSKLTRPTECVQATERELRSFLRIATQDSFGGDGNSAALPAFAATVRTIHEALTIHGLEFGHRTYFESIRLATILGACGVDGVDELLDVFLLQKILPRLHGSRRKLESTVRMLGAFAFDKRAASGSAEKFEMPPEPAGGSASLRLSYAKLRRVMNALEANQFASFYD
jgi:5-methylcytosine-specific restriction protein B